MTLPRPRGPRGLATAEHGRRSLGVPGRAKQLFQVPGKRDRRCHPALSFAVMRKDFLTPKHKRERGEAA